MADKISEVSLDDYVQMVLDADQDVAKKARMAEIDVRAFLEKEKPSLDKYSIKSGVQLGVARIRDEVIEKNSEVVKGLLVGARDRFGGRSPVRIPIISSGGNHVEVVNWGSTVKYKDTKIEPPFPSIATVKIIQEGEYQGQPNFRLVAIDSYEQVSIRDTVEKLKTVMKKIGDLDYEDEKSVMVIRGKIGYISPATRWEEKVKAGNWPVYMENQHESPKKHPVFQMTLESDNGRQVRVSFDRQRNVTPTLIVEDLETLCQDAVARYSNPVDQARFITSALKGTDVIVVGFLVKYDPRQDVTYIDMNGYAMFTLGGRQSELKLDPQQAPASKEKAVPAGARGDTPKGRAIRAQVEAFCTTLGRNTDTVSVEDVRAALKIGSDTTDSFIRGILEEMKATAK